MDFSKSFSYMFDDPEWVNKLAIGAVIAAVPVLNIAWLGYGVEVVRNVRRGDPRPLPNWDRLGQFFVDGLYLAIASFIYTLPLMIILCLGLISVLMPAFTANNADLSGSIAPFSTLGFFALMCVGMVYGLVYSFFYPAVVIHYSRSGTFGSLFQVAEIVRVIREDTNSYLIAWLVGIGASLLAGTLGGLVAGIVGWIPVIGWIASIVITAVFGAWAFMAQYYAYGLVGKRAPESTPSPALSL
jgi:hypothetical protein